ERTRVRGNKSSTPEQSTYDVNVQVKLDGFPNGAVEVYARFFTIGAKGMVEAYANLVKSAKPTIRVRELLHMPWLWPRMRDALKAENLRLGARVRSTDQAR